MIDRSGLILDIFKRHAKTKEATTQVQLAYLQYLLPRLTRQWTHLERQMGGIGTRAGMGETQIEVDRRIVRTKISKLKKELKHIENERETQGIKRNKEYRVSLVGYTNAGKSTLFKSLTGADVFIKNQLFATLDTTIRKLNLDSSHRILLSDTVGFIRKLPHNLVASFKSTLKEVLEADLILIVLDINSTQILDHIKKELSKIDIPDNLKLDGELGSFGPDPALTFQQATGIIKRKTSHPSEKYIEYHLYDVFDKTKPDEGFENRWKKLTSIFPKKSKGAIHLCDLKKVKNFKSKFNIFIAYYLKNIRLIDNI